MPGGLDFGKGLVDVNFQMWPLFCCLSLDNILTCCEIALSPTGRVLFVSKHPAMLGVRPVSKSRNFLLTRRLRLLFLLLNTSLNSEDGVVLLCNPYTLVTPKSTSRIQDRGSLVSPPKPDMLLKLAKKSASVICKQFIRYNCLVLTSYSDINYVNCLSPPAGHVSTKARRDRYRRTLLGAFDAYFHPDHSIPSEFKEAFPAGRFRPVVKIQSRRGAASNVGTEAIKPPEWWNWTRVVAAFNEVLQDRVRGVFLLVDCFTYNLIGQAIVAVQAHHSDPWT
jgi:nicotinamide N-methyltransferase